MLEITGAAALEGQHQEMHLNLEALLGRLTRGLLTLFWLMLLRPEVCRCREQEMLAVLLDRGPEGERAELVPAMGEILAAAALALTIVDTLATEALWVVAQETTQLHIQLDQVG